MRNQFELCFSKYAFFQPAAGGKIFGARLIYVIKNLSKKNNFQTDFLKNKIKIKIQGVATPPPPPEKKSVKNFSKYIHMER